MAVVDANVDRKGTRAIAEQYLKFLYSDGVQETISRHYYRPIREAVLARNRDRFPAVAAIPITAVASDWDAAQQSFSPTGACSIPSTPR